MKVAAFSCNLQRRDSNRTAQPWKGAESWCSRVPNRRAMKLSTTTAGMDNLLFGKQKKRNNPCPNPLFMQWLTEWKDDAAEKGLKSQYTYAHALKSLKKYPIAFSSGKECKILEHFGDKICGMLDQKLASYVAEYGTTQPVEGYLTIPTPKLPASRRKSKKLKTGEGDMAASNGALEQVCGASIDRDPEANQNVTVSPSARPRRHSSEYLPRYRSGPYALLLTLGQHDVGLMGKKELMNAAQPLADASFVTPDPGFRYTAWSSMGSLIKKGLVERHGNPARFGLTTAGSQLGARLEHVAPPSALCPENGVARPSEHISTATFSRITSLPITSSMQSSVINEVDVANTSSNNDITSKSKSNLAALHRATHTLSDDEDDWPASSFSYSKIYVRVGVRQDRAESTRTNHAVTHSSRIPINDQEDCVNSRLLSFPSNSSHSIDVPSPLNKHATSENMDPCVLQPFQFVYINEKGDYERDKDRALVTIDEECEGLGFLVLCTYDDLTSRKFPYKLDFLRVSPEPDKIHAYISGAFLPEYCTKFPDEANTNVTSKVTVSQVPEPLYISVYKPTSQSGQLSSQSSVSSVNSGRNSSPISMPYHVPETSILENKPTCQLGQLSSQTSVNSLNSGENMSFQSSVNSVTSSGSSPFKTVLPAPEFTLLPGMFDIILITDTQEKGSKIAREILMRDLQREHVMFETRMLSVGDYLWVARQKGAAAEPTQELVLDYVIERKRMDDLAGSIMDGRWKEQKWRLRQCGARRPQYLIEDYGSMAHTSLPEDSLRQAITNTQVVDGFSVTRTRNMVDSIRHLVLMSRYLTTLYQDKRLLANSKQSLEDAAFKNDPHDIEQRFLTFAEFQRGSKKEQRLRVRDMWARVVLQLGGVTAEKVEALLAHCRTPCSLFEAYSQCAGRSEQESLLANVKFGASRKNIGAPISKHMAMLYTDLHLS